MNHYSTNEKFHDESCRLKYESNLQKIDRLVAEAQQKPKKPKKRKKENVK